MKKVFAAVVVAAGMLAPITASADSTFEDKQPCVTGAEEKNLPNAKKVVVERYIETQGWNVHLDGTFLVKHYEFCGHPYGWVAISYALTKEGWFYRKSAQILSCFNTVGDGPRTPCDPTKLFTFELSWLRKR